MGNCFLDQPNTDKEIIDGDIAKYAYGAAEMQGWRNSMEDAIICDHSVLNDIGFFGVFDGHGGHEVAHFVKEFLVEELKKLDSFKAGKYQEAFKDIYFRIDNMLITEEGKQKIRSYKDQDSSYDIYDGAYEDPDQKNRSHVTDVGCTACSCILTKDRIICGNLGDSRAVLAKMVDGKLTAINLSEDHKPENYEEKKRIEEAGGSVEFSRVDGSLALSRAIGDYQFKANKTKKPEEQKVSIDPECMEQPITADCKFIVIACDGIWDVLSSQECVDRVNDLLQQHHKSIVKDKKMSMVVSELLDSILAKDTSEVPGTDNMSCVILEFKQ